MSFLVTDIDLLGVFENGRCVGENNKELVGELKRNDVTENQCATLCSEEPKITACEYDKVKQSCTAHYQVVTSYSTNTNPDDENKSCFIIVARGLYQCKVSETSRERESST